MRSIPLPLKAALAALVVLAAGYGLFLVAGGDDRSFADGPHDEPLAGAEAGRILRAVDQATSEQPADELVAEGRRLFRSTQVAKRGESCQACHIDGAENPSLGVVNHPTSPGDFTGPREPPALWGVDDTAPYGWTGATPTLDRMVAATIRAHFVDGDTMPEDVVARHTAALVAYVSQLDPPVSAFDLGTMSAAARRGEELFQGKGGCIGCHGGPLFTDNGFHDLGVPQAPGADDPGLNGMFNTPTLRDVANTGPYMHNGVLRTLREVVEFYNQRSSVAPLDLTEGEIDDLVAYLEALSR